MKLFSFKMKYCFLFNGTNLFVFCYIFILVVRYYVTNLKIWLLEIVKMNDDIFLYHYDYM